MSQVDEARERLALLLEWAAVRRRPGHRAMKDCANGLPAFLPILAVVRRAQLGRLRFTEDCTEDRLR